MDVQARQPLPRLSIPPSLNMQQPFDGRQAMFSPGLPTSLQQSYHPPPFPIGPPPLQTPMQSFFPQQPPNAPGRPTYAHHKAHVSMVHYPGFPPPPAIPMTPLGQGFPLQMMPPPFGPAFLPRNRRAPSVSIGGPPKAPLGGPGRKHSPMPPQLPATAQKGKKIAVNLPVETRPGEDGAPPTRPLWARTPMPTTSSEEPVVIPPEIDTVEMFPPESWRCEMPQTVDVFLPGRFAWDALKQQVIEEKLEKLGVERGSGASSLPIHAPHARAASISSPADPSLLFFKLNELRRSQTASTSISLSNSPQPPFNLSPSPNSQPPTVIQNRHGHSLSLAHPPVMHPPYGANAGFNPFGPSATLGSDVIEPETPLEPPSVLGIHAPQGRIPAMLPPLAAGISRGSSRPDFARGFGLDIPEEEEPQEDVPTNEDQTAIKEEMGTTRPNSEGHPEPEKLISVGPSTHHSRHVSKLSHTLSLRSVGGVRNGVAPDEIDIVPIRSPVGDPGIDDLDQEAVGEWTGSEDLRMDQSDDDESIGEWSNPSDEERARQARVQRRMLRHRQEIETPRRLPNFPAPPTKGLSAERRESFLGVDPVDFALRPSSTSTPGRRPLPPLPHSRGTSGQFTVHDPALAHSRDVSEQGGLENTFLPPPSTSVTLNPHAKPFVFGVSRGSGSWSFDTVAPPPAPSIGHTRLPSLGKPLNAAAQEFKPTGFTFRPPPGVPQLSFPTQEPTARPLPIPPVRSSPGRPHQGREKRQRKGSLSGSEDGNDSGKENMASFRFPAIGDTPRSVRRSAPTSPRTGSQEFHAPLQALTFSGFRTLPLLPTEEPEQIDGEINNEEIVPDLNIQEFTKEENLSEPGSFPTVAPPKSRRAPIPLDFKNPTTNTVPAGVFKALVGDEKTRRTVRSRLSSRDALEHSQRPSLDDSSVPLIASQNIFTPAIKRRSSLPALHSAHNSSLSGVSIPAINLTRRLEAQALEDRIGALLEEKFSVLRSELAKSRQANGGPSISLATEDSITEVVSLFRTQLQESAARGLDDSQMDARGELDLELIRDAVQRGHAENLLLVQTELREAISRIEEAKQTVHQGNTDIIPVIDQMNHRSVQVILNTLGQLSGKLDIRTRPFADKYERDLFIEEVMTAMTPLLSAMRSEPVDYNILTAQLSEAVKPNIEQLIDLAADKRETAGLIVNSILPLLPNASHPPMDTEVVIAEITAEVRRVIAPIDAHEIKEQVADLVVERLDSRLAVRDRAFNVDAVSSKITEGVSGLIQSLTDSMPKLDKLLDSQLALSAKNDDLAVKHDSMATLVSSVPAQMEELQRMIESVKDVVPQQALSNGSEEIGTALQRLESAIESISGGHSSGSQQSDELITLQKSLHQELSDRINSLSESLSVAANVLQTAHAEFAVTREATKHDADEIRKLKAANNDLQIQLAKARGAHGQVRVEKDNLGDRLKGVENERDRLHTKVEELEASSRAQQGETAAIELRNSELEEALSQSLARLKASDVATQTQQERIAELEKANRDATAEQQSLKSELNDLQLQLKMKAHERDLTAQSLALLQQEYERLSSQQSHWDDLRRNVEQIEILTNIMQQADNEELKELRRFRDQHQQLESEHTVLQRRLRDQELKVANSDRVANAAKQSLVQAQQRAAEWERRAKEYESNLEVTRNRLDEAEQVKDQLDADYSLAKLQLEEKEAEDRLVKDRESKLRDQVAGLESYVARIEAELAKATAQAQATIPVHSAYTKLEFAPSKDTSPPRPDSRASTLYGDRSRTPVARGDSNQQPRSDTPQSSVWDSMHAPNKHYSSVGPGHLPSPYTRSTRSTRSYMTQSVASPTPSTVSLAPTVDAEGWWS
ncbi:hypothetical protein SCLCIDRAFT_617773 [Scleroderma citrinum Foug A]|uniref:Uncharacterized protein n=1 Tax=Scleroderma citrinum Foug A TaxID=1036808 RepID=A0A0C3CSW7_9AGAM|nr:hypothetical protein SCLCIDRAFT_617773 [Scleroderma citrinum Foug A]